MALLRSALFPDPIRALLARGAQPRGTSARWSQAFAPRGARLSFGSSAWPNVSRPRERLRRRGAKYVQSRISASDVVCPSPNALFQRLGAVAQATGAPLSGATGRSSPGAGARATAGGRRHRFFRGRHDSRGRRAAIAREHRNERPRHGNDTDTPRTPARPPRRRSAPSGRSRRSRRRRVGGDDPRRWNGAQSPVALTPPLMRRRERNSAGAHLRPQKHSDPRRFRDGSQTPKIGFGDVHHTLRALNRPLRILTPRWHSHSRGPEPR